MPGNNPPCGTVSLDEAVQAINEWADGNLSIIAVIDLISSWSDPLGYPPS
jgi:hypothetical protein